MVSFLSLDAFESQLARHRREPTILPSLAHAHATKKATTSGTSGRKKNTRFSQNVHAQSQGTPPDRLRLNRLGIHHCTEAGHAFQMPSFHVVWLCQPPAKCCLLPDKAPHGMFHKKPHQAPTARRDTLPLTQYMTPRLQPSRTRHLPAIPLPFRAPPAPHNSRSATPE